MHGYIIAVLVAVVFLPVLVASWRRQAERHSQRQSGVASLRSRIEPGQISQGDFGSKVPRSIQRDR